jgi:class 3 adenylate cyclase
MPPIAVKDAPGLEAAKGPAEAAILTTHRIFESAVQAAQGSAAQGSAAQGSAAKAAPDAAAASPQGAATAPRPAGPSAIAALEQSLDILHADVFDSRASVALSAMQALAALKDPRSVAHIARLFSSTDPVIVSAAIHAASEIGAPELSAALLSLSVSVRAEPVMVEILRALTRVAPRAPETRQYAAALARAGGLSAEARAAATETLLAAADATGAASIVAVAAQDPALLDRLLQGAKTDDDRAHVLVTVLSPRHQQLALSARRALIGLAAPLASPESAKVFFDSFEDPNPLIRQECLGVLGTRPEQRVHYDRICGRLLRPADCDPALEEQALQAIDRMRESLPDGEGRAPLPSLADLPRTIMQLFGELQKAGEQKPDAKSEIGWLSASAREYVEFYCGEELRKALLQALKVGSLPAQRERCVRELKASAVRVEVRHFEGYKFLHELLAKPDTSGIAVVIRQLSQARMEKRALFCRLKRCLALARLQGTALPPQQAKALYAWARQGRLYRLAERALHVLHRADAAAALESCREAMTIPVASKILAVAACALIKDLHLAAMEPMVINLLHEEDRYVRLALLDTLAVLPGPLGENVLRAALQGFLAEADKELAAKLVELLSAKADLTAASALIDAWDRFDEWKKALGVGLVHSLAHKTPGSREVTIIEFLYKALRADPPAVLARIPAALLALGDDYATRALGDVVTRLSAEKRITLVRDLADELRPDTLSVLWPLLSDPDERLQQALGEVLPRASDPRAREMLFDMALVLRQGRPAGSSPAPEAQRLEAGRTDAARAQPAMSVSTAKGSYKFAREHVRTCAVLFSDIQGYSTKSEELGAQEITALIQEYENILLPIMGAHDGVMVKRMGDGHLFTFAEPLDVVMAAIRVQKALARFNRLRPEKLRVLVRIGCHWGEVAEQGGDVLGNTVNVASRLQTAAKGGSIIISQDLYERVAQWIHANDLGLLAVKGIKDPVQAWEPTELALQIPDALDPMKRNRQGAPAQTTFRADASATDGTPMNMEELARDVARSFTRVRTALRRTVRNSKEAALVEKELIDCWRELEPRLTKMLGR